MVLGFEHLPPPGSPDFSRPMLFVGNHQKMGFYDTPLLVYELYVRGYRCVCDYVYVRAAGKVGARRGAAKLRWRWLRRAGPCGTKVLDPLGHLADQEA